MYWEPLKYELMGFITTLQVRNLWK